MRFAMSHPSVFLRVSEAAVRIGSIPCPRPLLGALSEYIPEPRPSHAAPLAPPFRAAPHVVRLLAAARFFK